MIRYKIQPSAEQEAAARQTWQQVQGQFKPERSELLELFRFYYTYIATPDREGEAFLERSISCGWCRSRVTDWFARNFKNKQDG